MTFSSILRQSASSFAPLAVRALRKQRNCHSAVFTALNQTRIVSSEPRLCPSLPPPRSYSAKRPSSDEENLLRLLDSEIQRAEEMPMVGEAPGGFPFKIEDKLGFETITLSREYQGEVIKVEVNMHDVVRGEVGGDGNQDDDEEEANQSSIPMFNPDFSEEEIAHEGPHVQDSDDLQKAVRKYLEIRGIKPSMTNFLREYMINKDRKHYLMYLKKLKKFVEA